MRPAVLLFAPLLLLPLACTDTPAEPVTEETTAFKMGATPKEPGLYLHIQVTCQHAWAADALALDMTPAPGCPLMDNSVSAWCGPEGSDHHDAWRRLEPECAVGDISTVHFMECPPRDDWNFVYLGSVAFDYLKDEALVRSTDHSTWRLELVTID